MSRSLPIHADSTPAAAPDPTVEQDRVEFAVEGMHCAACVGRVQQAIGSVPGVTHAAVNLMTKAAYVTFDGDKVPIAAIQSRVADEGYTLTPRNVGSGAGPGPGRPPGPRRIGTQQAIPLIRRQAQARAPPAMTTPQAAGSACSGRRRPRPSR